MLRGYDLVVGHAPFAKVATIYSALCRKPYLICDAGWIRYLSLDRPGYARARKGYHKSPIILFTNVDTESLFREQGYTNPLVYSPFAIDIDKYSPAANSDPESPVFFHPARHSWNEKGNDRLIRAFGRYVKRNPNGSK